MLPSFNKHKDYLTYCSLYIYWIVYNMPQFNNYENLCELIDIYFRKFVMINSDKSGEIMKDCKDLTLLITVDRRSYVKEIMKTFEREEDAYHYLALTTQFFRISNKYQAITNNLDEICDFTNLL